MAVASPFELSLTPGAGFGQQLQTAAPTGGIVPTTAVYVRYSPVTGMSHATSADHTSLGAPLVPLSLTGNVVPPPPQVSVGTGGMSFTSPGVGVPSAEQSYSLSGTFLGGPLTISVPAPFEISLSAGVSFVQNVVMLPGASGAIPPTLVHVRYVPSSLGSHAQLLNHNTPGAATVSINLGGSVVIVVPPTPSIIVAIASLQFDADAGAASAEQSYTVSGSLLAGAINVSVGGPFEVSLTSGAGFSSALQLPSLVGSVPATTVYARYNPALGMALTGSITHTCIGVAPVVVNLGVDITPLPKTPTKPETSGCAAGNGAHLWILVLGATLAWRARRRMRTA